MFYFITVNYWSQALVKNLIRSISDSIKSSYRIIIVNNSPEETSVKNLSNEIIKIIEPGTNLGFGKACNLGIKYVYSVDKNAIIWLINPDTTVDFGADDYVKACLKGEPFTAILGTQVRDTRNQTWFGTGEFNKWNGRLYHRTASTSQSVQSTGTSPCTWVSGCSLIINLSQFDNYPSFDPHFFLYAEDADFCVSYGQKGYRIVVTDKALVTHQVSAIIGRNKSFMYEHYTFGRLFFLKKHAAPTGFALYVAYLLIVIAISGSLGSENALGRWCGLKRFYRNRNFNLDWADSNQKIASYNHLK
ncbi:glycosyltransferase family 2 protein [Trichocoleus desertorum AS-A10]|uniref:glycosyltransferase family 2 protein n=1 Tax=Trichocoleus desertorum TaxID=1481672 RepID=UPI0032976D6C